MEKELKRISCDPECGFVVQSHDETEAMDIARKHAKDKHNMDVSDEDLKGKMKTEKM
ncbi:MAG: DUF1059 domain-containing protein [Candidatus Moraniibacteriota bacterium]